MFYFFVLFISIFFVCYCFIYKGIDVSGEDNYQEDRSKQLILCECISALTTLKKGGIFICKLFDNFREFTVGLLYILYLSFEEISIVNPQTSRYKYFFILLYLFYFIFLFVYLFILFYFISFLFHFYLLLSIF